MPGRAELFVIFGSLVDIGPRIAGVMASGLLTLRRSGSVDGHSARAALSLFWRPGC